MYDAFRCMHMVISRCMTDPLWQCITCICIPFPKAGMMLPQHMRPLRRNSNCSLVHGKSSATHNAEKSWPIVQDSTPVHNQVRVAIAAAPGHLLGPSGECRPQRSEIDAPPSLLSAGRHVEPPCPIQPPQHRSLAAAVDLLEPSWVDARYQQLFQQPSSSLVVQCSWPSCPDSPSFA